MALPMKEVYLDQLVSRPTQERISSIECPICCSVARLPRETPCKHSFCLHCLTRWIQGDRPANSTCPTCREQLCRSSDDGKNMDVIAEQSSLYPRIDCIEDETRSYRITLNREILSDYPNELPTLRILSSLRCQRLRELEYVFRVDEALALSSFEGALAVGEQQEMYQTNARDLLSQELHKVFAELPRVLQYVVSNAISHYEEMNGSDHEAQYGVQEEEGGLEL